MNLNKVIIAGRLTADVQLKSTQSGRSVARMTVATNRRWNDSDGKKHEEAEFHTVILWGKQAEASSQFLSKGNLVLVEGRLATRSYADKEGIERKATEIIAEKVEFGQREERAVPMHVRPEDMPPME